MIKRYMGLMLVCALSVLVGFGSQFPAKADQSQGGLRLELALTEPTNATLVLGQPVILGYRFTNQTTQRIGIDLKRFKGSWYTVAIQYPDGNRIYSKSVLPVEPKGYHSRGPDPRFLPGEIRQGFISSGQWVGELQPGKATLLVTIALPFSDALSDEEYPSALNNLRQSGTLWKKEIRIPIEIVPADPILLRRKAKELLEASREKQGAEREAIIEALFLLPEKYGLGSWKALTTDRTARPAAIDNLANLETRRSAELLESMAWLSDGSKDPQAQDALAGMYNRTKDADLKAHIGKLYARHGVKVGDRIPLPDVLD